MITGIENFDSKLQKAILECIAQLFDLSEDIEIEKLDENIIKILDTKFYVISDAEQQKRVASYNSMKFDDYFEDLTSQQLSYIDEDKWYEDYGIENFSELLEEEYDVLDTDYYGSFNFYEIR